MKKAGVLSVLLFLLLPFLPLSSQAQQSPIVAREYHVPGVSAKDGSALALYAYEKFHSRFNPNQQAAQGRLVLIVHGATTCGRVNYDLQVPGVTPEQSFSLMNQLARRGYDAWTMDYQNYGRSDKHDCGLCVTTEVAARDIGMVAKFIAALRKVPRLHVIGWSWGGQTAGLFAQNNAGMVNRLVLYAPPTDSPVPAPPPPTSQFRTNTEASLSAIVEHPTSSVPEVVQAFVRTGLEVDPRSPNGVLLDSSTNPMKMDPSKITVPTLMIYGADDRTNPVSRANVFPFFGALATTDKKFVVVPNAGHGLFLQRPRGRWYQEVLLHLERGNNPPRLDAVAGGPD